MSLHKKNSGLLRLKAQFYKTFIEEPQPFFLNYSKKEADWAHLSLFYDFIYSNTKMKLRHYKKYRSISWWFICKSIPWNTCKLNIEIYQKIKLLLTLKYRNISTHLSQ